jgi:hypothetical protein
MGKGKWHQGRGYCKKIFLCLKRAEALDAGLEMHKEETQVKVSSKIRDVGVFFGTWLTCDCTAIPQRPEHRVLQEAWLDFGREDGEICIGD